MNSILTDLWLLSEQTTDCRGQRVEWGLWLGGLYDHRSGRRSSLWLCWEYWEVVGLWFYDESRVDRVCWSTSCIDWVGGYKDNAKDFGLSNHTQKIIFIYRILLKKQVCEVENQNICLIDVQRISFKMNFHYCSLRSKDRY